MHHPSFKTLFQVRWWLYKIIWRLSSVPIRQSLESCNLHALYSSYGAFPCCKHFPDCWCAFYYNVNRIALYPSNFTQRKKRKLNQQSLGILAICNCSVHSSIVDSFRYSYYPFKFSLRTKGVDQKLMECCSLSSFICKHRESRYSQLLSFHPYSGFYQTITLELLWPSNTSIAFTIRSRESHCLLCLCHCSSLWH